MNYHELLNELKENKRIIIPQALVGQFRNYAESFGIYAQGGAILPNDMRVLYID